MNDKIMERVRAEAPPIVPTGKNGEARPEDKIFSELMGMSIVAGAADHHQLSQAGITDYKKLHQEIVLVNQKASKKSANVRDLVQLYYSIIQNKLNDKNSSTEVR